MTIPANAPSLGPSNDRIPFAEMAYAKRIAYTADKNVRFAKLDTPRKRVAIAQDVLAWLRSGKLIAEANTYVGSVYDSDNDQTVDGGTCHACALGALMVCRLERDFVPDPLHYSLMGRATQTGTRDVLKDYFDLDTLALVETAFEINKNFARGSLRGLTDDPDCAQYHEMHPLATTAERWTLSLNIPGREDRHPLAKERMAAIMWNIIQNKGEFNVNVPAALPPNWVV